LLQEDVSKFETSIVGEKSSAVFEPSVGMMEFVSIERITQNDGNIYIHKSKVHTAIDFIYWTTSALQLFNCTTKTKH
jgi:hypothetical protein